MSMMHKGEGQQGSGHPDKGQHSDLITRAFPAKVWKLLYTCRSRPVGER